MKKQNQEVEQVYMNKNTLCELQGFHSSVITTYIIIGLGSLFVNEM
jgi:hypothetical protein